MAGMSPMISKRWLINYVLILLIIVFTYIGNKYNVKTGYQPDHRIIRLKTEDITSVVMQTADNSIHLSKIDGNWQIDSPIFWYANNMAVKRIIDIVNAQTDSALAASEIDLATLGLQAPKAMLRLNDRQIIFGSTNKIGERRYLQIDDMVYLVRDRYLPFITQKATSLVDRRLIPGVLPLESLTLADLDIRRKNGAWVSESGDISQHQADEIIKNWQTLEAEQIRIYSTRQTPTQKIIASFGEQRQIEFHVLSITPQLIIARTDLGIKYHFNEKSYYGLLSPDKDDETTD